MTDMAGDELCGVVMRATGSLYEVSLGGSTVSCRIRGRLRLKGVRSTNPVVVGDMVRCERDETGAIVIADIEPRRNYIIRRASNLSKESHIIAANVDQALLVATLFAPETAAEFIESVLDGAVLGGVFVVDAEELGGIEVCGVRDAGPLADVDGDLGVGLEGEGGGGAEEEGLGAEAVGKGVEVSEAECIGDGAAGGGTAAGGYGGLELVGGGKAVAREEEGLVPGLGFGAEPGELLVEASADGFGQRGGPATGGTGTDEGFEFLQGGRVGGCHVTLLFSQTVGCGGPSGGLS